MNTLSIARRDAEAAFTADPSAANLKALQAAGKAEMDAVLAAFDARNAAPVETEEATETAPVEAATPNWDAVTTSRFAAWFVALMEERTECTDADTFERTAYRGHISYELSMTDGYYAPEPFDSWVIGFRSDPAGSLYFGNDQRHALAPQVISYTWKTV
jgi:hypothetical protein